MPTLFKKANELSTLCRGEAVVYFKGKWGDEFIYCSNDGLWEDVRNLKLRIVCKRSAVQVDEEGNFIAQASEDSKYPTPSKTSPVDLNVASQGQGNTLFIRTSRYRKRKVASTYSSAAAEQDQSGPNYEEKTDVHSSPEREVDQGHMSTSPTTPALAEVSLKLDNPQIEYEIIFDPAKMTLRFDNKILPMDFDVVDNKPVPKTGDEKGNSSNIPREVEEVNDNIQIGEKDDNEKRSMTEEAITTTFRKGKSKPVRKLMKRLPPSTAKLPKSSRRTQR